MRSIILLLTILSFKIYCFSQQVDYDNSVRFSAKDIGNGLHIEWVSESNVNNYLLSRRNPGASSYSLLANIPGTETSYKDTTIVEGKLYEYKLSKITNNSNISGFMAGGIKVVNESQKGNLLLLIKENLKLELEKEINRLKNDLQNEGWYVITEYISDTMSVTDVKITLKEFAKNPYNIKSLYLLGNIPVPYAGLIAPDGHPDHSGAWPCDGFYADLDGVWTDAVVNNDAATGTRNDNIPGDGKYDQSSIINVELEIGRVDFSNLPAFSQSEIELTRNYLNKNHSFRIGSVKYQKRGLIQNNFPSFGEAFGQSGVNNFSRMFGPENIHYLTYKSTLQTDDYLWSYGCGPGYYAGAGGIGTTSELVNENHMTIFTMLFGSYFGDWDNENNYLRAALASGSTLTNVWAGRPHWYFHHMAMGYNIGYSTKITQNNGGEFPTGFGGKSVHIALMGDPTLTMYPPYEAIANVDYLIDNNKVTISWETLNDVEFDGYQVFYWWGTENDGKYILVNTDSVFSKSKKFEIRCIQAAKHKFMIKALQLQHTGSGSFFNPSKGLQIEFDANPVLPTIDYVADIFYDKIELQSSLKNGEFENWVINGEVFNNEIDSNLSYLAYEPGDYIICLTAKNECNSDSKCDTFFIESSLPEYEIIRPQPLCYGDTATIYFNLINENATFELEWEDGSNGLSYVSNGDNFIGYKITTSTGRVQFSDAYINYPEEIILNSNVISEIENESKGSITVSVIGGTPPYRYVINSDTSGSGFFPDLYAGEYKIEVIDANGCKKEETYLIQFVTSTKDEQFTEAIKLNYDDNYIYLNDSSESMALSNVSLINIDGQFIGKFTPTNFRNEWTFSHRTLPRGIYLIHYKIGNGHEIIKWLK